MAHPEICRWCKHWDIEAKFKYGMGAGGKCHCKYCGDMAPDDHCGRWELDYDKTEEQMKELYKHYGF